MCTMVYAPCSAIGKKKSLCVLNFNILTFMLSILDSEIWGSFAESTLTTDGLQFVLISSGTNCSGWEEAAVKHWDFVLKRQNVNNHDLKSLFQLKPFYDLSYLDQEAMPVVINFLISGKQEMVKACFIFWQNILFLGRCF